jgi:hypothetical protein
MKMPGYESRDLPESIEEKALYLLTRTFRATSKGYQKTCPRKSQSRTKRKHQTSDAGFERLRESSMGMQASAWAGVFWR